MCSFFAAVILAKYNCLVKCIYRFCAVLLLISIQYAQYGLDELPTRLHYCVNDLSIYRGETNDVSENFIYNQEFLNNHFQRVRKLLRDDFFVLNSSLYKGFDTAGDSVVAALKQKTGAVFIDELLDKTNSYSFTNIGLYTSYEPDF